jgi:hypothetical protein
MSLQTWVETLVTQQAAGTSFATFTTAKTVINAQALYTLPPGFWSIGKTLEIDVMGEISNIVTTPGTITMQVMMGSIVAFTTGAMQMSTTAHTALPFWLKAQVTCRAVGASTSANLMGQAVIISQAVSVSGADATTGHASLVAPNTTPAVGTGFDSTISNILDFWVGFSISNAANLVRVSQYTVKSLN